MSKPPAAPARMHRRAASGRARWPLALSMVTAAALLLAAGRPARAQPMQDGETTSRPSRADLEEAKARFLAGRAAVEAGRWADAVENFERAYQLSKAPSALYNLAVALRALGRYREARDQLERLFEVHGERLSPRLRADAERYLEEARGQVATLLLEGLETELRHRVRVDGRLVPDEGERPLRVEVDPGRHALVVRAEGRRPFEWEGEVGAGATERIEASLLVEEESAPAPSPLQPAPPREEEEGGLLSSPWFWVGTTVVLAAGAGAAWWLLGNDAGPAPQSDRVVDLSAW